MTVADLCELYITKHCPTIKTGVELKRRLRADVIPVIGSIKLSELHRRDLHRVLDARGAENVRRQGRHLEIFAPCSVGLLLAEISIAIRSRERRGRAKSKAS